VLADLGGRRALVTGGTGFIGGRLVERLVRECGADVRALVRNLTKAPRLARFPVDLVPGDAAVREDVLAAAEGCDLIFHCAYGNSGDQEAQRHGTVGSTQYVLEAAAKSGARVVNVSTVAVYGPTADGDLTEASPRNAAGDVYSESKLEAERLCAEATRRDGIPAVSVQPTMVYGPFGPAWTLRILNDLANWRVILVDGGRGLCNAVYVDDVVTGLILAATRDEAVGEVFLLAAAEPVTWAEFYGRNGDILGLPRGRGTVEMSRAEAEALWQERTRKRGFLGESMELLRDDELRWRVGRTLESSALYRAASRVTPWRVKNRVKTLLRGPGENGGEAAVATLADASGEPAEEPKPVQVLPPAVLAMLAAKTRARVDKARRLLGYEPAFDFATGMERTHAWARWAGLAREDGP